MTTNKKLHPPTLQRLLSSAMLFSPLLLAAAGCVVGEEDLLNDQSGEEGAAPDCTAYTTKPIFVYDPSKRGRALASLSAAGANLVTGNADTILIHIDGSNASSLTPIITRLLDEKKHIVLDSDGDEASRSAIGTLAGSVAGLAANETALSILQYEPGAFTVTPLDLSPTYGVSSETTGNRPLALLAPTEAGCGASEAAPVTASDVTAAADTITKYRYQQRNQPRPPIVYHLVDNKATHVRTGFTGSDLKRYLYRGDIQTCPSGVNKCTMSWSRSESKAVAHGTSVNVKLGAKLTEKLSADVSWGYSLTVTTTRTLTWTNAIELASGWSGRPVSYIWRRSGYGDVKNAYVFKSRRTVHSACRPGGGCYAHYDTYERQPNTTVATWSAHVVLNQGSPTNSWNTFRGNTDPNSYTFDSTR